MSVVAPNASVRGRVKAGEWRAQREGMGSLLGIEHAAVERVKYDKESPCRPEDESSPVWWKSEATGQSSRASTEEVVERVA